jgi:hypothetical protein
MKQIFGFRNFNNTIWFWRDTPARCLGVVARMEPRDLPVGRFVDRCVKLYFGFSEKYFCSHAPQINSRTLAIPPHKRGVS